MSLLIRGKTCLDCTQAGSFGALGPLRGNPACHELRPQRAMNVAREQGGLLWAIIAFISMRYMALYDALSTEAIGGWPW